MKTVLITGAANGLGKSLAATFLSDGYHVVGLDMDPGVKALFQDKKFHGLQADVTKIDELQKAREDLGKLGITIDVLINNAGYFQFLPITDSDAESLNRIFQVNALAAFTLINLFRDDLIRNQGRVIQISSENVKISGLFQPYPSTKIALESLSIAARQELSLVGVKLIIIRPGAMETDLLHWDEPQSEVYQSYLKKFFKTAQERMDRIVQPEQVSAMILKAANSKKPALIYNINHNRWLGVFSSLPQRWIDQLVVKMLK